MKILVQKGEIYSKLNDMKHILLKIFGILAALLNICGMCNKPPEMEVKATKEKVFNHNYVVINSVDNSPV